MAKKGEFRYLPDPETGEPVLQRYGTSRVTGRSFWKEVDESQLEGRTMSGGKVTERNKNSNLVSKQKARDESDRLFRGGPAAVERARDVDNMSSWELQKAWPPVTGKFPIVAGRETDKLLAGAADLKDIALDISGAFGPNARPKDLKYQNPLNAIGNRVEEFLNLDTEGAMDRINNRKEEQATKDKFYKEFDEKAGANQIAAAIPYYVSGLGVPAASRNFGRTVEAALSGVERGAKRVGGRMGEAVRRKAASGDDIISRTAKEVETDVLDPLQRMSDARANRPPIRDEFREGTVGMLGGSAGVGGAEGLVHYDESPLDGMISSLIGTAAGKIYEPKVSRAPSKLSASEQETLDWAYEKGYRPLPGLKTGQPKYQSKESGLRNDERFSGPMKQLDDANDEVVTRVAGETMGLSDQQMKELTPASLEAHLADLKGQYTGLQEGTVGRIDKAQFKRLQDDVNSLPETKANVKARKDLNAYIDNIKNISKTTRDSRGRFKAATFDGASYQKLRSQLKSHADTAWDKNRELHSSLTDMIKVLDDSMYEGVEKHGGTVVAQQWKDLNERYAMTKLVMNNGMDPVGGINVNKLGEFFSTNDMERLLTGRGGRVSDLHRLVKLNHLQKSQKGSGLAGPGIDHVEKPQKRESARLLNTPAQLNTGPVRRAMLRAYQMGIPSTTGLLGLPRKGPYTAPNLMRIIEQGTDVHPEMYESGKNYITGIPDRARTSTDKVLDWLSLGLATDTKPEEKTKK